MKTSTNIHIDIKAHKRTIKSRTDFTALLGQLTPQSPFYKAHPELQSAGAALIQAGADLATADGDAKAADATAAAARSVRDTKKAEYDRAHSVFAACVEKHAVSSDDLTSIGCDEAKKNSYAIAAPLSITAVYNPVKEVIEIEVKQAPGMVACFTEVSPDPAAEGTYKRLPGIAAVNAVGGYAPGLYWIRAASAKGSQESGYVGPVSVIVK